MRYRRSVTDAKAPGTARSETRANIIAAASRLLREFGPVAVTTRGVAQAAKVQAPTIYRLFGDKDGLLDAVAEQVMQTYVSTKSAVAAEAAVDPVADLRAGWDRHIEFGLANPALFRLLADPDRGARSPAAIAGNEVLRSRIGRIAAAGRLRVGEQRALELIQAAGTGAVLTLLATPERDRDPELANAMYDAVSRVILTEAPVLAGNDAAAAAVTFRTIVPRLDLLSRTERALMAEWLDRVIDVRP